VEMGVYRLGTGSRRTRPDTVDRRRVAALVRAPFAVLGSADIRQQATPAGTTS